MRWGGACPGHGGSTVTIEGVETLHGCNYRVMADRIEAGTFAFAVAITGGDAVLQGANAAHLRPVLLKMAEVGIVTDEVENGLRVRGPQNGDGLKGTKLVASPHPGFSHRFAAAIYRRFVRRAGHVGCDRHGV